MGNTTSTGENVSISKEDYVRYKQLLQKQQQEELQKKYREIQAKKEVLNRQKTQPNELKNNVNFLSTKINQKLETNERLNNYIMNNNSHDNDGSFSFPKSQMSSRDKSHDFNIKMDILENERLQDETSKFNDSETLMNNITKRDIDPYNILEKQKMSLEKLQQVYKKLLVKNHPDKGGKKEIFQKLVETCNNIGRLIEYQNNDKTHEQLKNNYEQENNENHMTPNINLDLNKNFNNDKFNEAFNRFRFEDNIDSGYGDMMVESDKEYKDIEVNNFIGKYNKNNFQQEFINHKKKNSNTEIIEYKPPEALESLKVNYATLGQDKLSDYGDSLNNTYTDYKKAYSHQFINVDDVQVKQYKSIEELKNDRKKNTKLSDKERRIIEEIEENKKKEEWKRQERLKSHDFRLNQHFQDTNQKMLQFYNQ